MLLRPACFHLFLALSPRLAALGNESFPPHMEMVQLCLGQRSCVIQTVIPLLPDAHLELIPSLPVWMIFARLGSSHISRDRPESFCAIFDVELRVFTVERVVRVPLTLPIA